MPTASVQFDYLALTAMLLLCNEILKRVHGMPCAAVVAYEFKCRLELLSTSFPVSTSRDYAYARTHMA